MNPAPELLDEHVLEEYFEGLCRGDYQSLLSLTLHEAAQVQAFTLARLCQWNVQLEQRTTL